MFVQANKVMLRNADGLAGNCKEAIDLFFFKMKAIVFLLLTRTNAMPH